MHAGWSYLAFAIPISAAAAEEQVQPESRGVSWLFFAHGSTNVDATLRSPPCAHMLMILMPCPIFFSLDCSAYKILKPTFHLTIRLEERQ